VRISGSGARAAALAAALLLLAAAPAARAVDLLGERLHVNGFVEEQVRGISRNFADDLDLTQWYHVLNVELEADLLPNGGGPFSSLSAYARLEVRYDCVWTRACGLARSADTFGDRASKVPRRLGDARFTGYHGHSNTGDRRLRMGLPIDEVAFAYRDVTDGRRIAGETGLWNVPGVDTLFGVKGIDQRLFTADDPAAYTFARVLDARFALREIEGVRDGAGTQVLGPWLPKNRVTYLAALADRANPFRAGDVHPVYTDVRTGRPLVGSGAQPYRPAPALGFATQAPPGEARGLWYPNPELRALLARDAFHDPDQEFSEAQLAWNRGASQEDEKELKEAYLDAGFLEDRLVVRIGKQSVVWGKTELFRTTDQFNPQDLALSSLPSLEESRIALFALRAFWSFYEVGPLSDVRLEVAANFDQFEPADIGRCGEPYTPNPACDKTFGLFAHGLAGLGISGEIRPEEPWKSWKGLEGGARLEFRWDRFSFALTDFWGWSDLPYTDKYFTFERNVDAETGLPRRAGARGACRDLDGDGLGDDPACLRPEDALAWHSANQSAFAMVCSSSVGFAAAIDANLAPFCAQSVFNATAVVAGIAPATTAFTNVLAGSPAVGSIVLLVLGGLVGTPAESVVLGPDLVSGGDNLLRPLNPGDPRNQQPGAIPYGLDYSLSPEQRALLGCGPYFGTRCDGDPATGVGGIDLLNAEASALLQSFPGYPGAAPLTTALSGPQPSTIGFAGGVPCLRYERGTVFKLPGCRGPADAGTYGYDPAVDGSPVINDTFLEGWTGLPNGAPVTHPFTGAPFASEMAILSWNLLQGLVALSVPAERGTYRISDLDPNRPLRTDGCSFAAPQYCATVQSLFTVAGQERRDLRAGGDGRYGRVDFAWHGGSPVLLRYDKRNVLGFSMDFAEDRSGTNWSFETTWIAGSPYVDNDSESGIAHVDEYNLTVSVDRPTFIHFLNPSRTFFFNSQWFFQWLNGYERSFSANGPLNVLATFTVQTGYFQDRLLPSLTLVYDFQSGSGALLPQLQYRFTESFSLTLSLASFWGRFQEKVYPLRPPTLDYHVGRSADRSFVENGLAPIRDRDELAMRLRYTF
jgi:hypothetical protein